MLKLLLARAHQGHRTTAWPRRPPVLPDRFRGPPVVDATKCAEGCQACVDACPTQAIRMEAAGPTVDLGRCLFCTDCAEACPSGAVTHDPEYRLASSKREELVYRSKPLGATTLGGQTHYEPRVLALDQAMRKLFGRSLKLRQVSAGGCNGCESDVNVLGTIAFDLGRFGIQFVASPRHADGLLITGPVTQNMKGALEKTYAAVPAPKLVIAVGACAISGGPFAGHPEACDGASAVLPVDLYIPGCPPHPFTILDGLLGMLGQLDQGQRLAATVSPPSP